MPAVNGRPAHTSVTIFDPVAGNVVQLDAQRQTAMVRSVKAGTSRYAAHQHGGGDQPAFAREDLGASTINGRPATGTRMTRTIPAGAIGNQQAITVTRTVWMSADLKVPLQIVSDDPRFGATTTTLTNIVQSEPDAALFQIPSGYTTKTMPAGRGMHGGAAQSE